MSQIDNHHAAQTRLIMLASFIVFCSTFLSVAQGQISILNRYKKKSYYNGNQEYIIGGQKANMGDFRSLVSISTMGEPYCGGTLVDAFTVVTAGHCMFTYKDQDDLSILQITAGMVDARESVPFGSNPGKDVKVTYAKKIIMHENFQTFDHFFEHGDDIAIIKLQDPIPETANISYATLPKQGEIVPIGKVCTVAGWGTQDPNGWMPSWDLMKLNISVVEDQLCVEHYHTKHDSYKYICVSNGPDHTSPCSGDSGGPLYCNDANGKQIFQGLVSIGETEPCAPGNIPSAFLRISTYIDWIAKHRNL